MLSLSEQDAHGRCGAKTLPLVGEDAGFGIAGEDTQLVGTLIGHEHPAFGGIEGEIARDFAAATGTAHGRKGTGGDVSTAGEEEVVAAIGKVDELSVFGNYRVASGAGDAGDCFGLQIDARLTSQAAVGFIPL